MTSDRVVEPGCRFTLINSPALPLGFRYHPRVISSLRLVLLAVTLPALAVPHAAPMDASAAQPALRADLVLYNGRVITVDGAFSIAEAVAIAGDRIVAVGTTAEVRAIAGTSARQIDLRGRALIPGLMDNHLHSAGGGPGVDLSRARSLDDVYAAIRSRAQTAMPGEAIVSNSDWHEAQLKEQRLPLRDDLDRVAPNHPGDPHPWRARIHRQFRGASPVGC